MRAVVSSQVSEEIKKNLASLADVFFLPPDDTLARPVCCHPDMILSVIGKSAIISQKYARNNPLFCFFLEKSGYNIFESDTERGSAYPHDVGLNAAVGNGFIICRKNSADASLLIEAERLGYIIIDVKQGYAGCSCIVCGNAVITSDRGISEALTKNGIENLYVRNDGIMLSGYDVGFIGGCGGFYDGVLYFFGNIDSATAGDDIRLFADKHGYEIASLSDGQLTDYGGIKFL